tara:strand:- start:2467 stop:3111 length:645 start_codon:yes stop_codon:yes gene_type:complete
MVRHGGNEAETFKDQIAKATLRLVTSRGNDRVTTSDVARAMGITRAAMARHCPTGDDLWLAVAALIERRMKLAWSAAVAGKHSPSDRLRSLLAVQVGLITDMPLLRTMLLSGGLHADNRGLRQGLCEIRQGFKTRLVEALMDGQRAGQFCEELDAGITADRIMEAIQGMIVSRSLNQQTNDFAEEVQVRLDAFLHGTAGRPQAGPLDDDQHGLS